MNNLETTASAIVNAAISVHRELGPGLLESAYQQCLVYELRKCGNNVKTEILLPIKYDGLEIEAGYRIDMIINEKVIVENKAVKEIAPIHKAQLLTYLKLGNFKIGFLLNWNVNLMRDGIKRMVHRL